MIELLAAIKARSAAVSGMTTDLPGGVHLDHPGPGTLSKLGAFAVISVVSAVPEYNTSRNYHQPVGIQVSLFTRRIYDIRTSIAAWRDTLNFKSLTLTTGSLMECRLTNEMSLDDQGDENEAFHSKHYLLEFEFTQKQAHA